MPTGCRPPKTSTPRGRRSRSPTRGWRAPKRWRIRSQDHRARDDAAAAVRGYDKAIHDLGKGVGTPADLAFAYYARGVAYAKEHQAARSARRIRAGAPAQAGLQRCRCRGTNDRQQREFRAGRARPAGRSGRRRSDTVAQAIRCRKRGAPPGQRHDAAPACSRALNDEQRASQSTISPIASYDASIAGLAENARCTDDAKQVVNEGYLRSSLAAAEHELKLGDWRAELKRADEVLARCETLRALRSTSVAGDCLAQRRFNDNAAAQWSPASASPAPSPSPSLAARRNALRVARGNTAPVAAAGAQAAGPPIVLVRLDR